MQNSRLSLLNIPSTWLNTFSLLKLFSYLSTVNPGLFFAIFAHCARRRGIRNFGQLRMPAQGPARSRAVVIASTAVHATPKEASTKVIGAHEKVKAAVRARNLPGYTPETSDIARLAAGGGAKVGELLQVAESAGRGNYFGQRDGTVCHATLKV